MRTSGFLFTCVLVLAALSEGQTITLTLQQDLSSKLPTGAPFTAHDAQGKVYHGHVLTHPARRVLRRGSMRLVFDEPVVPAESEGIFRAGNKMRLLKLGVSLAAAKLADDAVDGVIGATKARYVGIGVAAALSLLQKGGEAKLRRGDTVEVEPRRSALGKSDYPLPTE